jgi:predicted acylesterase/phospholipase RssA
VGHLHAGGAAAAVADSLLSLLRPRVSVVAPGPVGADGLDRAERSHERVLLSASTADEAWRDFCLRQADQVVLVASATAEPAPLPDLPRAPDLVLLGPAAPPRLAAWAAAGDIWQVTRVDGDLRRDLRPMAERIAGRSLGLVLAGGGARAFAHVGVLRELAEAGVHVDRVAGCSIGAVIAALHATGKDGEEVEDDCYTEFVRRRPFSDYTVPARSLARGQRTRAGLGRTLGADTLIDGLPRQFHTVSTDLVSRSRQVHRHGNLVDAVLASSRLPVLFAPMPDGDRLLVDGGILDNLPVDLLTERAEGPVVAVNISMGGGGPRRPGTGHGGAPGTPRRAPRVPALGETLLRTMMIGSGGAVAAAKDRGAAVLTPSARGAGLLEFHQFDRLVEAGRVAARELLARADGDIVGRLTRSDAAPPPP